MMLRTDQFDVAVTVQEEVLRLEIAVDDVARVQVIKGLNDAGRVEQSGPVVEMPAVTQDRPQLAAQTGLHQHIDVLVISVRVVQPNIIK